MECRYSLYDEEQSQYLLSLAREYGLAPTGGSDFHGSNKPHISIGTGTGQPGRTGGMAGWSAGPGSLHKKPGLNLAALPNFFPR